MFVFYMSRTGAVVGNMSPGTNLELKYKRKLDTKPQKGRLQQGGDTQREE